MTRTQTKPPSNQRRFANGWAELDYLCGKIRYWLCCRKDKKRAERYVDRLSKVLRELPQYDDAILQKEGLALLCELKGQLAAATVHRQREIQLMERLHEIAESPRYAASTKAYMLQDRDTAELQERRSILNALQDNLAHAQTPNRPQKRGVVSSAR